MSSSDLNTLSEGRYPELADRLGVSEVPGWKRTLDVSCILLAAPVWLPLGLTIGILIKVVSPGPALFRQERVGHMGRRFRILKFRTMKVNADTDVHREHLTELMTRNQAMKKLDAADKRLIRGGLLLRTMGLDELPQLINVLRGEMSLVGPRPSLPYEFELYQSHHRQRCRTLPGLTGLWQVNGKNRTTFERMMELDLEYVKNKSLLLDLKILACTIPAILKQVSDVRKGRKTISHAPGVEKGRNGQARIESSAGPGRLGEASLPLGNGQAPARAGSALVSSARGGL